MNYWNDRFYYPTGDEVPDPDETDPMNRSDEMYESQRDDEIGEENNG